MADKCIIQNGVSSIEKDGKFWVIDSKYRVTNLSECKIVETELSAPIPSDNVPTPLEIPHQPVQHQPVQHQPVQHQPSARPAVTHTETRQIDPNAGELNQLLSLAGDNAWLVGAVLLFVFGKQYLEKMEKMKMADTRTKDDLTKECVGRHDNSLDKVKALEDKINDLTSKIEGAKTDFTSKIDKTRSDCATLEKRLMSVEMEVKYQQPSKDTAPTRGRPKKDATDDN